MSVAWWCSVNEEGLYDYVVFNHEVEEALTELKNIAEQALQGLSGQGAKLSKARAAADAVAASPKVTACQLFLLFRCSLLPFLAGVIVCLLIGSSQVNGYLD